MELSRTLWHFVEEVWNILQPFRTLWKILENSRTFRNCLETSGTF